MENNTQPNVPVPPPQPLPQQPTFQQPVVPPQPPPQPMVPPPQQPPMLVEPTIPETPSEEEPPSHSKLKILLFGIVGIVLLGVGLGTGYFLGANKQSSTDSTNPSPTQKASAPSPTKKITPTLAATPIPITIPLDWKQFTAEDPSYKVRTTMSMPPGYSFRFTGSEFTIQDDATATELWDYATSIFSDTNGVLKNHYTGGPRREWYADKLSGKYDGGSANLTAKILGVNEVPLNNSSYLVVTVQYSNNTVQTHFVYVQNGILHVIRPVSSAADSESAQIRMNIATIFASLTSAQLQ